MAAVLLVLRAGLVAFATAVLLGLMVLVPLVLLRLAPMGEALGVLIDLILLGTVVLVLTQGTRWVPPVPARSLFRPVAGVGDVAAAFRIGLAFMGVQWIASPLVHGELPEFTVRPGALEVAGFIASATVEEVLFRGYLLGVLFRSGRPWAAVLAPSALFAVLHLPNLAACGEAILAPATLVPLADWYVSGMVFATMTVLSGRIWPAVAVHALHNVLVTAVGGGGCD